MKKRNAFLLLCTVCVVGVGSAFWGMKIAHQTGYKPSFQIIGDVAEVVVIQDLDTYTHHPFTYKEAPFEGVSLGEILEQVTLIDANSSLHYVGNDGLVSQVDARTVEETYCLFSNENGWELINLKHPISSNMKHLKEIVVVSEEPHSSNSFSIFDTQENFMRFTPGEMYVNPHTLEKTFEGESMIHDNFVRVYTSHITHDMEEIMNNLEKSPDKIGSVFLRDGSIVNEKMNGTIELVKNKINYVGKTGEYLYDDVVGLYIGEQIGHLSDAYYEMEHYLKADEKMMVLFIDGFSYATYEEALRRNIIPTIATGSVSQVFCSHESVTNTGFATMITGVTPEVHGVHNREYRSLNVDTIFQLALDLGIQTAFLEGSTKILDTEISPTLHIGGDLEIMQSTKEAVLNGDEFIFVHAHQLDEYGHLAGVDDQILYDYLETLDEVIADLVEHFDGKIMITTDHGMHNTEDAGDHGDLRYEDIVIPLIRLY
ncbi:MAG: alkaline phosphatase family protein [Bacillota bacterium]